ncbi:MAG: alpha/beta fold hydrolase [Promethearchaeota archaeon]|jgi:pimeloyl-ACP methyl ester carboxylesterase
MPKIKVNDINIAYEVSGEGHPLVMIMGSNANKDWWGSTIIKEFSKHFKVIIFDNRGMGRTDIPDGPYTIQMMVNDTIGLMDALNIDRAHIMGASMGGGIALELTITFPERVNRIILVSAFCGGPNAKGNPPLLSPEIMEQLAPMMELMEKGQHEELARILLYFCCSEEFINNNPDLAEKFVSRYLKNPTSAKGSTNQFLSVATLDTFERLPQIYHPTLIMHGTTDRMVPFKNAEIIKEQISGAELISYENVEHLIYLQEEQDFIKRVIEFLTKNI